MNQSMSVRTAIAFICVAVIFFFGLVAQFPFWMHPQLDDASKYGDAFGVANAVFSGFGFLLVAITLLLQMQEIRESAKNQREQTAIQQQQIKLTERTVQLQRGLFDDARRRVVVDAFLKIHKDAVRYRNALLTFLTSKSLVRDIPTRIEIRKDYYEAWTELRSNCLVIGLLFDNQGDELGRSIEQLYANSHPWIEMDSPPPPPECQVLMNQWITEIEQNMKPLWATGQPKNA